MPRLKNDARIDFRLNIQTKELIERAALLSGQSLSDFAASTLVEKARELLMQEQVRVLSLRDSERFLMLLDDQTPNATLRKAARRFKKRNA